MNEITKSLCFTEASSIKTICEPLKKLNITGFVFFRNYKDGTMIDYGTGMDWAEHFYKKLYAQSYERTDVVDHHYLEGKFCLWEINPENSVWQDGREHFNAGNGISLITDSTDDYSEVCCFYDHENNHHLNEFYLNNLDLLLSFSLYFKDKSASLIAEFEKSRLTIPPLYRDTIPSVSTGLNEQHQDFISFITPRRFYFQDSYLTRKEAECLSWLARGKTSEENSIILSSSKRTIESHIQNIKNKLDRYTKADLIDFAIKSGIINFFRS